MKDKRLYIAIIYIAIISIILSYYSWPLGIACMMLGMYITFSIYRMEKKRQENWSNYIKELSEDIDVATKNAVMSIPMPLVVLNDEGIVIWHNKIFRDLIGQGDILDENILDFLPDLDLEKILINRENLNERMLYKDQWYDIIPAFVDTDKGSENQSPLTFLYMRNITEKMRLKGIYDREQIVIVDIQIDNYDEVMANTEDTKRPALLAQIDGKLSKWASSLDASWRKYDRDKFLVIMEKGRLEEIEKDKFQILDVVREIDAGNKIPVTLSIGVGVGGSVPSECNSYARSAMDLALGRGGDQAVVKHGDKLFFYGGKTRAVEKSSKVKSR
ncbi:MAG: phosphoesterase, partial [Clostridiales bacterium]|nr:phosphoesterase [Clostridiales bacterium]